ncbi:MAG: HlyD family secretion protein [Propionibacterium sp.]|nr:HlyD family secretion protein [Propionibacterium sp.]
MTWPIRLRLLTGLALTVAMVLGLTLMLNRRTSQATSTTAVIAAGTYDIGSEYAGTVRELHVTQGQVVQAGDPVATVHSGLLQQDLTTGEVSAATFPGRVTPEGLLTLVASEPGTVTSVGTRVDSFLRAGSVVASIDVAGSRYVEAEMELEARDYARLVSGAPATLTLPDRTELAGVVDTVSVTSEGGWATATVRIASEELATATSTTLTAPGTPVTASVHLQDNGAISETLTTLDLFLQRLGS